MPKPVRDFLGADQDDRLKVFNHSTIRLIDYLTDLLLDLLDYFTQHNPAL